jgi:hypothetical protein
VTADFVERRPTEAVPRLERSEVSSNEGGGSGRLFAFVVDQNTLDMGSARRVADGAAPFFAGLTYADRSALLLMPLGPNVSFTWAHDRVQAGLRKVTGMGRGSGWEYGSLSDARAISNRSQMTMRSVSERECGFAGGGGGGGGISNPGTVAGELPAAPGAAAVPLRAAADPEPARRHRRSTPSARAAARAACRCRPSPRGARR